MAFHSRSLSFLPSPTTIPDVNPTKERSESAVSSSLVSPERIRSPVRSEIGTSMQRANSTGSTRNSRFSPRKSPPFARTTPPDSTASSRQVSSSMVAGPLPSTYIAQSRSLLDQQRKLFDQERSLFDQERAMWETEREVLQARIKELEAAVDTQSARPALNSSSSIPSTERFGETGQGYYGPPASRSHNSSTASSQGESGERFWEGSSSRQGSVASRTFSTDSTAGIRKQAENRLPSISEREQDERKQSFPAHPQSPSPEAEKTVGNGIDISVIREDLDGITLKESAVSPAVVAMVRSPSPVRSPPPSASSDPDIEASTGLADALVIPLAHSANLTKHAGHTPLATSRVSGDNSINSSGIATPTQTQSGLRPHRPSAAVAVLGADATLPEGDDQGDSELAGPLSLQNDSTQDSHFLEELDIKLLQEARKIIGPSESSSMIGEDDSELDRSISTDVSRASEPPTGATAGLTPPPLPADAPSAAVTEPDIQLKFKRSMNFGSAFGAPVVGAT